MAQQQTSILAMGRTSHVPYLAMEARVVMQVLHQMLNCISRQWKTTTLEFCFTSPTICSIRINAGAKFTQLVVSTATYTQGNTLQG